MNRSDLTELHYITPIANVPSILQHGILCHNQVKSLTHQSVAMPQIQQRRIKKLVPGGRHLHDYANLYFDARNPMLYLRKDQHEELCVLRISTDVLDLPGVVIADGNAASAYTAFFPSPEGLRWVDENIVFAKYWTSGDQIEEWRRKRIKCAEVLVPDCVGVQYILGAYVSCGAVEKNLRDIGFKLPITASADLFFL
jgi:hypothetical protein